MRNGYELSPEATHFWLRKQIADALRSENYWRVDCLIGGFDDKHNKSWLSSIDYLGNGIENQVFLFFNHKYFANIVVLELFIPWFPWTFLLCYYGYYLSTNNDA